MKIYKLLLLLAVIVLVGACTPMARNNNTNDNITPTDTDQNMEESDSMNDFEDSDDVSSDDVSSAVQFSNYENKAVGYTINIPTTWYWQHFIKSQISDVNPGVDDFLFISPTRAITSIRTELPAEIMVEVSEVNIDEFKDDNLSEIEGTISGQKAIRAYGVIDNELFENYRKIEYRFTKDNKTFRILYMAPVGMEENERIFEAMVNSFSFSQ